MKIRSAAWCVGMLMLVVGLTAAEAVDPGPLELVATLPLVGVRAHEIAVGGDYAYVGTSVGLTIVRIADPDPQAVVPRVVGSLNLGGQILGIALKESHVYLANRTKDFQVVDVSDPTHPVLVTTATRALPGNAWDAAVKDNVAYVASFAGEVYLFDITDPTNPQQFKVLGIPEWVHAGQDPGNLAKLNSYVTVGAGKATGVSVAGNKLTIGAWNYGRFYYYDVTNAMDPIFLQTHYAPFTFRTDADPERNVGYMFAAFGASSGLFSVTLPTVDPTMPPPPGISTRSSTCTGCDYFKTTATDFGGLAVSPNGNYVVMIYGKRGVVHVFDVTDPADLKSVDMLTIPPHGTKTGEPMGVVIRGNDIFTAAGSLGLRVYRFQGLAD